MARTKQTARKSTSGPAPRVQLSGSFRPGGYRFNYGNLPLQQHVVSKEPIIPDTAMASNAAMTSDAQMKVFSTPEILVIILSQLPHTSLLKAKLVNKTWASLSENVEIQASLFERPRPKESALYAETYSDLLMNKFLTPWPTNEEEYANKYPSWQWRQLLICQPPVEVLEVVQQISQRVGGTLEFRTIIPRPNGLRMGFLYDAIRHWHQVEKSPVELLWNRKTGDLTDRKHIYPDGPSYKAFDDKPCVTIWGKKSVGCGQSGGLTYELYRSTRNSTQTQKPRVRVIKSDDEKVKFSMSEPKLVSIDLGLLRCFMEKDEEDEEEDEDS
ncbi:Uncharacterized protein BP5553_09200 [Venustampulla echinocandica]|uniref:F-box domain-containing protein n=1 Tax=Venustampulla echinocandica TaxID=2656787 RepID=A0A370TC25_9HELO|nr:Uncharacterized protein BP5553_09200 [Venustampulla echinocandica]RDL31798.1 Uncharacterized protein BP5553_09200 [Venustampulla echinocandica]